MASCRCHMAGEADIATLTPRYATIYATMPPRYQMPSISLRRDRASRLRCCRRQYDAAYERINDDVLHIICFCLHAPLCCLFDYAAAFSAARRAARYADITPPRRYAGDTILMREYQAMLPSLMRRLLPVVKTITRRQNRHIYETSVGDEMNRANTSNE